MFCFMCLSSCGHYTSTDHCVYYVCTITRPISAKYIHEYISAKLLHQDFNFLAKFPGRGMMRNHNVPLKSLSVFASGVATSISSFRNLYLVVLGNDWLCSYESFLSISSPSCWARVRFPVRILSRGEGYDGVPKVDLLDP